MLKSYEELRRVDVSKWVEQRDGVRFVLLFYLLDKIPP